MPPSGIQGTQGPSWDDESKDVRANFVVFLAVLSSIGPGDLEFLPSIWQSIVEH